MDVVLCDADGGVPVWSDLASSSLSLIAGLHCAALPRGRFLLAFRPLVSGWLGWSGEVVEILCR